MKESLIKKVQNIQEIRFNIETNIKGLSLCQI